MGFAQWFWRLFLLLIGLIAAHACAVTMLLGLRSSSAVHLAEVWAISGLVLAVGAAVIGLAVRRMVEPLAELSRHVRSLSPLPAALPPRDGASDDLKELTGAFDQMQRSHAGRLLEFQSQSQRLESVLSNMAEGVLAAAPDSTILIANDSARRLLDFAAPNPLGRPLLEVTRARPVIEALQQALASKAAVEHEFEAPGVSRKTLSLRATRLPGEPCPGVLIVLHDMTELRRLENLRRELVANVSHELKTPLAAIKGYAETLRLGAVNDPEHNVLFIHRIEEQADRLHTLILDMLKLARLESGQQTLEYSEFELSDALRHCVDQFSPTAAAKQIEIALELPANEMLVVADEEAFQTIVNNLIDNAVKYTAAGGRVVVRAGSSAATLAIEVEDNGIGIAELELARIFERFYRVDKARSRELGGTGLGLSIVKHFAQAHGGAVSVASQVGRGTTFRVELPLRPANGIGRRGRQTAAASG